MFTYVGIVTVGNCILKCLPKYVESENAFDNTLKLKCILKVLDKYNKSKFQSISMYNDSNNGRTINKLAIMIYLLRDYVENGIYTNVHTIIENNGQGEIVWDKTINETFALISNGNPYYLNFKTKKKTNADTDYFKRIHEAILTQCSRELNNSHLSELFDLPEIYLTDETIDRFGDRDYILYRISNELNIQYSSRKIRLLKTLYCFIANENSLNDINCFNIYGTNSFNLVWEKVCSCVLDNKLHYLLKDISLPKQLTSTYIKFKNKELIDIIEKPKWFTKDNNMLSENVDTLIPDIVSVDNDKFIIFDAKYYKIILEKDKKLSGQPGISDITKQYLYQLAYKDFIQEHGFNLIYNCFLMPSDNIENVEYIGEAKLDMLSILYLESIKVFKLSADYVYNNYLNDKHLNISLFQFK